MAAQQKLFQRLIWLVDTIYSAGRITREEIDRRWSRSIYNDDHDAEYGERNFHRHRDAVYELFGIEIVCNRTTREYSLSSSTDEMNTAVRSWLVDTFAINNMVNIAGDMRDRILFENIPEGTRYLSAIVSAMKEQRQLQVTYQRFDRHDPHTFLLSPYCLKVFRQRWYLIGKPSDHPEERQPRVYSLDRVLELSSTDISYKMPKGFKASEFFENQFGIDRSLTKAERIVIRVTAATANYIRTLPIHDTQLEIQKKDDFSDFSFRLAPTYDFIQELRKHGSNLEVLEPAHLREEFRREAARLAKIYKK